MRPTLKLEGKTHSGHFRHTVRILGQNNRILGEMIVTADALDGKAAASAGLVITPTRLKLGAYHPGHVVQATVALENTSESARTLGWKPTPLASLLPEVTLAPREQRSVLLALRPPADLWGKTLQLEANGEAHVINLQGYPRPADTPQADRIRIGPLEIHNVREIGGQSYLDFGILRLGESRSQDIRIRNASAKPVALARVFTSARSALELSPAAGLLAPGEERTVSITWRGTRRPGSFRRFFHLLTAGVAPRRIRIGCIGYVESPQEAGVVDEVTVLYLRFARVPDPSLTLLGATRRSLAHIRTLDHRAYERALAEGVSGASPAVCSNCTKTDALRIERDIVVDVNAQRVRVLSVLGDEAIDDVGLRVLPWFEEPNGAVLASIHPPGFDEQRPKELPVVIFHDAIPLVAEAARRTRMPAVYVVAGRDSAHSSVRTARDVLMWSPGYDDERPMALAIYVRDSRILHWALVEDEG